MTLLIIALFTALPILEVYILLQTGAFFGALSVALACIATAVIGGFLLRIQGLGALSAAQKDLQAGRTPLQPMVVGMFLLIAAPFLMTPGFLTDAVGFSLLIPPVRGHLARLAVAFLKSRADLRTNTIHIRRP